LQFGLAAERTIDDNNTLTLEQIAASIAELEGRLAKSSNLSFKVSEKGAVSIYGLGRFPVTLFSSNGTSCLPTSTNCGPSWKPTNQN